jgi:oxygen-dependent protoporphyrinogen oxidase
MTDLDVAVAGAGLAGLAVADLLRRAGRTVQVFEATPRVGGRMATLRHDGYALDEGAEMISQRGYPATWRLIERHGLRSGTDIVAIPAGVAAWRDGRACTGVAEPFSRHAGGLSLRGRAGLLRLGVDLARPSAALDPDHPQRAKVGSVTVADLARTYGDDMVEQLLRPLAEGMFGWRADRGAAACFLANMAAVGGARHWRTYADGMDTLARRIAATLPVQLGEPVTEVMALPEAARLTIGTRTWTARTVVLALPAPQILQVHQNPATDERAYLAACRYAPMLRVGCLLDRPLRPRTGRPVHMLAVPHAASPLISGLTFDHLRHPGRAPAGRGLVSVLAAPTAATELLAAPDEQITAVLTAEADRFLPGLRDATRTTMVSRFQYGLPEPTPQALAARAAFLARPTRLVEYAGDWLMLRPSSEGAARSAELAFARLRTGSRHDRRKATR